MGYIGNRLRFFRTQKKMTQDDLARAIGTTKQTIYKYETGIVTNIPMDRVEQMASALGVTPADLMGWSPDQDMILSSSEKQMLVAYRGATEAAREIAFEVLINHQAVTKKERA